jgi:bifunctional non-homologous end joining protein LigD
MPSRKRAAAEKAGSGPLAEYERKRDFEATPEPPPSVPVQPSGNRFFVQRHDATRLHYDFRLEIDGVLKSWAIPKGPTLDPTRRNLAMMVEDHPIDYGDFEGNIPKGNYGGGSVMLWDHGTYDLLGDMPALDQIKRGDLKFRLHGDKVNGDYALVLMKGRGKGNEWLLIKKKDDFAQVNWDVEAHSRSVKTGRTQEEIAEDLPPAEPAPEPKKRGVKKNSKPELNLSRIEGARESPMPKALAPMMAYLTDTPPGGKNWVYEIKWDGVRALCFIRDGKLDYILSRTGNHCERQYPEMSVLPRQVVARDAIIDGEIAVLDEKGRPSFSKIQPRIAQTDPNSVAHLSRSTPITFFAFDIVYCHGYDLRDAPLSKRREVLKAVFEPTDRFRMSDQFAAEGKEMLAAAKQAGLEGIVAKQADSKYESRRSRSWLKLKARNEQEFLICGFTHGERSYFSSLVLGVYRDGKLVHAGQVGTGFDDRTIHEIHSRLQPLITDKSAFSIPAKINRKVTWVRPELVCEVAFLEWTPDGQLRAPSFVGLREDVTSREVVRESSSDPGPAEATGEKTGPLLDASQKEAAVEIDGRALKFTNLNKIWFPGEGYTKRDVINYYDAVAALIIPHLGGRPLSLKRYPNGVREEYFFQKHAEGFASWVRLEPIPSEGRVINYVICNDRATLLYLANLACIDQNPWMSRIESLDKPDFMLIDLDPVECPFDMIVEAALLTREVLDQVGLRGYPKTTGGDGMHIYVPVEPIYTYDQVRGFAEILSHLVVGRKPDLFTTPRTVAKRRKGRVYFDYLQIAESKTISAPYVIRPYDGAPVATPLGWDEVKPDLLPQHFTIENAPARFAAVGDLFGDVLARPQRLESAMSRLESLVRTPRS